MYSILRWLLRFCFKFRAYNLESLRAPGPILLIPNHVSWLDWLFIGLCLEEDWRFVTSANTAETTWLHKKIMVNRRTFPIDPTSPYSTRKMAEYLATGGRLVLFAEGRLSRTGSLMKLFEGTGFLIHKTQARVITCYLKGANRLLWARQPGRRHWFPQVTVHFSEVLTPPPTGELPRKEARPRLTIWLREQMVRQQFEVDHQFGPTHLLAAVIETARQCPKKPILEDVTFKPLTYRRLLVGVDVLASAWERRWKAEAAGQGLPVVGVLLPNVNATPLTVLSLWAAGCVPALLNFSTGSAIMLACARLAGLKHIITSRAFMDKARLDMSVFAGAGVDLVYLEDVRKEVGGMAKLAALARQTCCPGAGLVPAGHGGSAPAVILFTSGSEGVPKGVELSHDNILANVRQSLARLDFTDGERIFNALPLFHSFGLGTCTMLPLIRGLYIFLYPSPLHYRIIPEMVYDRACTVMVGTNTFLMGYGRKAHPYDFQSVKYLVAGAEKLQEPTAKLWAQKFGLRVMEGYGATECSPVISVNSMIELRTGSVGRFLPGIEWKLEPVEGIAEGGRLLVKGPNVMHRYLNPEADAHFKSLGGWYDTGDLAKVDGEGFLFLLGRLKRFAKISGEMVSLTAVEDALAGAFPELGQRCEVAILTRPDADKGEVLIAVTNDSRVTLEMLRTAVRAKGLGNLCVPREIRWVKEIPKLGTGKIDYRTLSTG